MNPRPREPLAWQRLLAVAGPALYFAGLGAASLLDGQPFWETDCFNPAVAAHLAPGRAAVAVVMAAGAVVLLVVVPWLLGLLALRRFDRWRRTAGAWSLAANTLALILVLLALRHTAGISRASFLYGWSVWTLILVGLAGEPTSSLEQIRSLRRRWGLAMLVGLATLVTAAGLFYPEHFLQCFEGDGIESYELARSLREHFLPYWEIEWIGQFGSAVVNPVVIDSYWACALQTLLGDGELATRLPFWLWRLGMFAALLAMVRRNDSAPGLLTSVPLALFVFLGVLWNTFDVGWDGYVTEPVSPGAIDACFTLFLLLAFECLRQEDLAGWVVMMALGSLVLYAGPVMFVLTAAAGLLWQPVARARMAKAVLAGLAVASAIALFYLTWGWLEGSLPGWWATIDGEYVDKVTRPLPRWPASILYAGYFLLGCGLVPIIGLLRPFQGSRHAPRAVRPSSRHTP